MSYLPGAIRTQEALMLQRYDDRWKPQSRRDSSDQITPILAINVPSASEWISAAAQAEFVGGGAPAATPTQIAQPVEAIKIVRSN
jgi:hypothetical protein